MIHFMLDDLGCPAGVGLAVLFPEPVRVFHVDGAVAGRFTRAVQRQTPLFRLEGSGFFQDDGIIHDDVHHTDAYDNSDIVAPGITGYFLLVLQGNDSRTIHHVMVR